MAFANAKFFHFFHNAILPVLSVLAEKLIHRSLELLKALTSFIVSNSLTVE